MARFPQDLNVLIWAHDNRAAPIFRKGLDSRNPFVVDRSVAGLAGLGDPSDIETIIRAAYRSDADIDSGVARELAYYRKPDVRKAIFQSLEGTRLYERFVLAAKVDDQMQLTRCS